MATTLTEFEKGFNAGLEAAIEYHEIRARGADRAARELRVAGREQGEDIERLGLSCICLMMTHRGHGNALRERKKLTDTERKTLERLAEKMD